MEIEEGDDFADDRYAMDREFSDDDSMEEEEEIASRKKKKSTPTTSSSSRRKEADELEVLDHRGEIRKRQPLIEKYRPASLDEVVAQDDIVQTITRLMEKNALPHLLLYGPPGTGKT